MLFYTEFITSDFIAEGIGNAATQVLSPSYKIMISRSLWYLPHKHRATYGDLLK